MDVTEFNYNQETLDGLVKTHSKQAKSIRRLIVVNSDRLKSMKGVGVFFQLEELNLSSNAISAVEDLKEVNGLRTLNLSANRIRVFPDISFLSNLKKLILSSNGIVSLANFRFFGTKPSQLEFVDLADNRIHSLKELKCLENIPSLKTLVFEKSEEETNPICSDRRLYVSELLLMKNIAKLKVDGLTLQDLQRPPRVESPEAERPSREVPVREPSTSRDHKDIRENRDQRDSKNTIESRSTSPKRGEKVEVPPRLSPIWSPSLEKIHEDFRDDESVHTEVKKREMITSVSPEEAIRQEANKKLESLVVELHEKLRVAQSTLREKDEVISGLRFGAQKAQADFSARAERLERSLETGEQERARLERKLADASLAASKVESLMREASELQERARAANESASTANRAADTLRLTLRDIESQKEMDVRRARQTAELLEEKLIEKEKEVVELRRRNEESLREVSEVSAELKRLREENSTLRGSADLERGREKLEVDKQLRDTRQAASQELAAEQARAQREKETLEASFRSNLEKPKGVSNGNGGAYPIAQQTTYTTANQPIVNQSMPIQPTIPQEQKAKVRSAQSITTPQDPAVLLARSHANDAIKQKAQLEIALSSLHTRIDKLEAEVEQNSKNALLSKQAGNKEKAIMYLSKSRTGQETLKTLNSKFLMVQQQLANMTAVMIDSQASASLQEANQVLAKTMQRHQNTVNALEDNIVIENEFEGNQEMITAFTKETNNQDLEAEFELLNEATVKNAIANAHIPLAQKPIPQTLPTPQKTLNAPVTLTQTKTVTANVNAPNSNNQRVAQQYSGASIINEASLRWLAPTPQQLPQAKVQQTKVPQPQAPVQQLQPQYIQQPQRPTQQVIQNQAFTQTVQSYPNQGRPVQYIQPAQPYPYAQPIPQQFYQPQYLPGVQPVQVLQRQPQPGTNSSRIVMMH